MSLSRAVVYVATLWLVACDSSEGPAKATTPASSPDTGAPGTDPALCERHPDTDGDGFGDTASVSVACDAAGYVDNADDCDDSSADVFPGAPERCNLVDDDCDDTVDEELVYEWYADVDNDGYGAGDSIDDCDPPDGFVDNALDCQDTHPGIHPDASEVCNGFDDDCNGLTDDEDPAVDLSSATTWHADEDGDGFGDAESTSLACNEPESGFVLDASDCDDTDAQRYPDAPEVCDAVDNDCDGLVDDDDPTVDLTTGSTYFPDLDADGYGDPDGSVEACALPSGLVTDSTDCDDTDSTIHPDATEVCDSVDNDCDADIDDADGDVDLSTGIATYLDRDGDGFGDADSAIQECAPSSGRTTDATDCNDADPTIHPSATEVCNEVDDDCDADIDDADADLDTSTAETWYLDADADGYGDPTSTTLACEVPSGYVDNGDDCDDSGFADYDGDLVQDCDDDDADGDGLSGLYDVDDLDDTLVRGPTGGLGTDGALTLTGASWSAASDFTLLSVDASTGDTTLTVDDGTVVSPGDEVILIDLQGDDAGVFAYHFVTASTGSSLTIEPPLTVDLDAADVVQVQRVPHYTTVAVSGTLSPEPWDGAGGGLVVFRATGAVSISGGVDASGAGYLGGSGVAGNVYDPTTGGSYAVGPQASTLLALRNDGGGGARVGRDDTMTCGGGGGFGTEGGEAESESLTHSYATGNTYGDSALSEWFLGSGGGGGSPDTGSDGTWSVNVTGDGGAGGGLIAIYSASQITVTGSVLAHGADGVDGLSTGVASGYRGELGGGGGGSGGQILLVADTLNLGGSVWAHGGAGGSAWSDYYTTIPSGGDGGEGRTRLEYTTLSGLSYVDPAPSTGAYED